MCESNVYLRTGEEEKLIFKEAGSITFENDQIRLSGLLGEEKLVSAKIKEIDLLNHKIILEPR